MSRLMQPRLLWCRRRRGRDSCRVLAPETAATRASRASPLATGPARAGPPRRIAAAIAPARAAPPVVAPGGLRHRAPGLALLPTEPAPRAHRRRARGSMVGVLFGLQHTRAAAARDLSSDELSPRSRTDGGR